jgi:hypothetical protein
LPFLNQVLLDKEAALWRRLKVRFALDGAVISTKPHTGTRQPNAHPIVAIGELNGAQKGDHSFELTVVPIHVDGIVDG